MDNQEDQNFNETYSVQMEDKRVTTSGTISEDTDADLTQVACRLQESLDLTPTSTQLDAMETLRNSTITDPDLTLTQTDSSSSQSQVEAFVTAREELSLGQDSSGSIGFQSQSRMDDDDTIIAEAGASSSQDHEKYALKLQAAKGFSLEQECSFIPGPSKLTKSFGKSKIPILPGSNIMANQQLRHYCGWDSSPHPHTSTPIPDLIRVPQLGQSMNLQGTNNKA